MIVFISMSKGLFQNPVTAKTFDKIQNAIFKIQSLVCTTVRECTIQHTNNDNKQHNLIE